MIGKIKQKIIAWLRKEAPPRKFSLSDFEKIQFEVRPCDILLVEGRSRISNVIKAATQSPWSHSALYIGRLHDIANPMLRERILECYAAAPDEQLLIESVLGRGTIITPITRYQQDHVRICRPKGIARQDAQKVIEFAIDRLGREYDVRHTIDLFRFLLPWSILPRRWRSSLFEKSINQKPTQEICSSMLAEAFTSVKFPILPIIKAHEQTEIKLYIRNPRLFTPSDFDYSPYFEIIKYPIFDISEHAIYRKLPWDETGIISNGEEEIIEAQPKKNIIKKDKPKPAAIPP